MGKGGRRAGRCCGLNIAPDAAPLGRERSFAWAASCRRPARDRERLPQTVAGPHFAACAMLMPAKTTALFDLVHDSL